jgi:hypothetical protein
VQHQLRAASFTYCAFSLGAIRPSAAAVRKNRKAAGDDMPQRT